MHLNMRRTTVPSILLWLGVAFVLAWAVSLVMDLNRASQQADASMVNARVNGAYSAAHDAFLAQRIAGDPAASARAAATVDGALRQVAVFDPGQRTAVAAFLRAHGHSMTFADDLTAAGDAAGNRALALGLQAFASERKVVRGGRLIIVVAAFIFGGLWLMLRSNRRRLNAARKQELERLSEMASSDPLTGLRNHRVFQEDLARELQRAGRTGVPLALVLLDLDKLKTLNDTFGHQAGDEQIRKLADALRANLRATDIGYRIGGDEFAVILPAAHAWGALEFTQRLRQTFPGVTAGIADAVTLIGRDELIHDADMALLTAKRTHQHALVFTPELNPEANERAAVDDHHIQTLASALARAVDAKDAYTRSHCQTVSQLSALIAAELGLEGERLASMRLAGLLHDVGKIGVPDAILNKPAALTDEEFAVMRQHSVLGFEIVESAELPEIARWVRHHHERIDGRGYPDGLAGEDIPLESRIILVADSFEAMTSDRPYRRAPGREFAVAELRRNAGTQFDPEVVDALCRVLQRSAIPV
jgi:diguanylate cyclase (GGDEF)-like protein/putative nucleotidyltransferase with HDIG domain